MDAELQKFFTDLHNFSKSNKPESPADCYKLLDQLNNNLTKEELGASKLEKYFYYIFHKDNGLLVFLNNVAHNSSFKNATIKSTEIIYALINNFPKIVNEHVIDINEACLSVFLKSHSAAEKVKALNVITLGFEKIGDKCVDNLEKYERIYRAVVSHLAQTTSVTVKEAIFISLGMFAKQFSYVPSNQFMEKEFKHLFINKLEDEIKQNHCQSILNGIFTGLAYLMHGCPLEIDKDQILIDKLYKSIQEVVRKYKKATSSKTGIRE